MAARWDSVAGYSRLVRWMKILLPLAAVALIAAIFLIPRERASGGLTAEQIAALGAGLALEQPRISGATETGEPYEIAADRAVPDGAMPDRIELEAPTGRIATEDHGLVTMRADTGLFSRLSEIMELEGGVVVQTADGYRFEAGRAEIDIGGRSAVVPGAVRITGPFGSIEAGSMRAAEGSDGDGQGPRIWFENRVHMVIIPGNTN